MKFVHCKQEKEFDCGIACINSILKYYKIDTNIEFVKDVYHKEREYTLLELKEILEETNMFKCKAFKVDGKFEDLTSNKLNLCSLKLPCIALINNNGFNHYVVIYKIRKSIITISDPDRDKIYNMKIKEFDDVFKGILLNIQLTNYEDKTKDNRGTLKKEIYLDIFKLNFKEFFVLSILSIIFVIVSIVVNFYFKISIDYILPNRYGHFLTPITLIFLSISIIKVIFNYLRNIFIIKASIKIDNYISISYLDKITKLPIEFFKNRNIGQILSRFNDSVHVRSTISTIISSTVLDAVIIVITSLVLYRVNKIMFLIITIASLLSVSIIIIFYDSIEKKSRNSLIANTEVNTLFIQFLKKSEDIFALNKNFYFFNLLKGSYSKKIKADKDEMKINILSDLFKKIIQSVFPIILIFIGIRQILYDKATLGDIIFINSLAGFIFSATNNLINIQNEVQKAIVAMDRICDILLYPLNNHKFEKLNSPIYEIKIKNLNFSYKESQKEILKIKDLTLKKNEKIIINGKSGVGKSTFAKILVKLNKVDNEKVFINGIDINCFEEKDIRDKILYISSEPFMHMGSIRDNLCLGKNFTENEIINACKKAMAWDFIDKLDNKLDFILSEDGGNLSTGQRQRISLARVFLYSPEIIILDEAISNVGNDNLISIYNELFKLDSIVLFITHNINLISKYNKILLFKENDLKIIED